MNTTKYYLCINHKKDKEHRANVAPSDRNPMPSCVCGAWYSEVTKEEWDKHQKELDITH